MRGGVGREEGLTFLARAARGAALPSAATRKIAGNVTNMLVEMA